MTTERKGLRARWKAVRSSLSRIGYEIREQDGFKRLVRPRRRRTVDWIAIAFDRGRRWRASFFKNSG